MSETRYPAVEDRFPFDLDFQRGLLRLLTEDSQFSHLVGDYLEARYFEHEALQWAWGCAKQFREQYGAFPTLQSIRQNLRMLDVRVRPIYELMLEQVAHASLRDENFMRDAVLDFVKRNIFVRAFHRSRLLYNDGKVGEAYDFMLAEMERLLRTTWAAVDASWFFEELPQRQVRRLANDSGTQAVTTGFNALDHMMGGGLSKGELGIWIAYAKGGKSSMLVSHGVAATQLQMRPTAHFVFEGSRRQVEDRYESAFNGEQYRRIREGGLSVEAYQRAYNAYQLCRSRLYVRGFTEEWNYSVMDVHSALKDVKRSHDWSPDLVIVDYGDLLSGREKHYNSEREKQKAAFRDLKSLANRGYAVWSASQAQRPTEKAESEAHWVFSRMIADCYEKVRVADFLGSLNTCPLERADRVMRVLAELYRDNEADVRFVVRCDLSRMLIRDDATAFSRAMPDLYADRPVGVGRCVGSSPPPQMPGPGPFPPQGQIQYQAPGVPVQTYAALRVS